MGRLVETRTRWEENLPALVTAALETWVERRSFDLELRGWFTDGRSGAPVARTVRKFPDGGRTQQLILKFWNVEGQRRVDDLADAWHDSPHYQEHLAEVVDRTIDLGDWRAMLMRVAGGNLNMAPLGKFLPDADFSDYCATVVRSVLGDWNEHRFAGKQATAADVLREMLVRHWERIEGWARSAGLNNVDRRIRPFGWPVELVNPLALADGRDGSYVIDDLIVGKAHGDLNGRNILVPTRPNVAADAYVLIDYDRYSAGAPLTRDPMHLLVALALDSFHKVAVPLRPDLARVIIDPDTPGAAWLGPFQKISAAIHSAPREMAEAGGMGREWEDQCLLSLVGAGLVHVGRNLHVADQKGAKEWCFHLAALAADAYVRRTPADNIVLRTRSEPADDKPRSLVDRSQELAGLRARLSDGAGGVLVVQGARGIGKTALVNAVLTKLGADDAATRVQRHDVNAITSLDASTLVDHVVGPERAGPGEHRGSSLVRLEDALHRYRDCRVVVTIDSAENLGDRDTGRLMDPELDDALELIATEPGHRVTVLMVTRQDLRSPQDGIWPETERFNVGKLPQEKFFEYLTGLDHRGTLNLSSLTDESCAVLYSKLQGNPRLAQLVYGTVVADGGLDIGTLTSLLASQDSRKVPSFLTRLLIDRLSAPHRRVLEALAAFDTPVPEAAVSRLLEDEAPDEVGRVLSELTDDRVGYRVDSEPDQYFIPSDDGRLVLACVADEKARSDLYSSAADVLTEFRVKQPKGVADLRVHFAELRALLRAGEPSAAYETLEGINHILRAWNCADLLLQQRLELRTRLVDDHLKMANENALADLYLSRGDYREADKAYGNALNLGGRPQDDIRSVKVLTNLAAMYWEINDTDRALGYYQLCLEEADKRGNLQIRIGALEGLADCFRRRGDYQRAIRYAEEALAAAERDNYSDTPAARNSIKTRSVVLALKLARWHGELGNLGMAAALIEKVSATAGARPGEWLHAAIQDARADRYLNLGELELATQAADQAVDEALALHDPIILLQARTTLCFAYLKDQYIPQAGVQIAGALRHRRPGRSLVVLALSALAARQKGDLYTAHQRFHQLLKESNERIDKDSKDFAAWDFRGVALCGRQLDTGGDLDQALRAVERARSLTPPTPVLVERLRFLLTQLDESGHPSRSLRPVIDALADPSGRYS